MKKILIVLLILTFAGISSAQGFKLGVAGNVVFPTGDWKELTSSTGWGVDAFGVFDLMLLTLTVRAGYLSFGEKETQVLGDTYKTSISAVPVMAGLRWDFGMPVGPSFYVGAEAGIHNFTTTVEAAGQTIPSESETKFAFAPNVGMELAGFDISAYYMLISDANYWGVRVGWGIGI
jgi:opacity protein-like surface antigen